ncbi:MAG: hypothetical protein JO272_06310 [Pseudonocardiales bacterium]|nr:hypothetical protein [Pseudonocardiales bacterium]
MRGVVRWTLSPVDGRVHLLVLAGDLPWGVLKARCGAVLPSGSPWHERPPGGAHRTCPTCAEIAERPTAVPVDRWVSPQDYCWGPVGCRCRRVSERGPGDVGAVPG